MSPVRWKQRKEESLREPRAGGQGHGKEKRESRKQGGVRTDRGQARGPEEGEDGREREEGHKGTKKTEKGSRRGK